MLDSRVGRNTIFHWFWTRTVNFLFEILVLEPKDSAVTGTIVPPDDTRTGAVRFIGTQSGIYS